MDDIQLAFLAFACNVFGKKVYCNAAVDANVKMNL